MTTTSIIALLIAYLLGSIPSAVWIGKLFFGTDVREHGSGNAGATNTFRVLGKKAGIPVLLLDILKGFLAVNLAWLVTEAPPHTSDFVDLQIVLGVAAVLGHIFPVFAGFRGGKGIATLFGVTLAVHPQTCLLATGVFLLVFLSTNYVSLGSISAGLSMPLFMMFFFASEAFPSMIAYCVMVSMLILITHQKNIERLLRKEESKMRLTRRKNSGEDASDAGVK
ncbi:MAG TPA: glycerol-3-phosphate 1-O-acyltransferase PlsY [Bacteroidia bacterium]|nr:glycerol-3-phosphate 1-O-acyltransferase PlsY [Bacteroidia bacterium]